MDDKTIQDDDIKLNALIDQAKRLKAPGKGFDYVMVTRQELRWMHEREPLEPSWDEIVECVAVELGDEAADRLERLRSSLEGRRARVQALQEQLRRRAAEMVEVEERARKERAYAEEIERLRAQLDDAKTSHAAKLTWLDVREIRARSRNGSSIRALADEWGVSPATVHNIIHHRSWREDERHDAAMLNRVKE